MKKRIHVLGYLNIRSNFAPCFQLKLLSNCIGMMKYSSFIIILFCLFPLVSCIQDEPLNAEADIVAVDSVWVKDARKSGLIIGDPIVENRKIIFMVKNRDADLTHLAPLFKLTPGATISPAEGTERDFSTPQVYTVTSQDGNWKKEYTVSFIDLGIFTRSSFETWEYDGDSRSRYLRAYDLTSDSYIPWASGNSGFALTGAGQSPLDFPTAPAEYISNNGLVKCAKLETKSTGKFGADLRMPIAPGNMFIGEFNAANAIMSPLKATKFGLPVLGFKPEKLRGKYKYKAGDVVTDKWNQPVEGAHDACDIYGVIYEVDPENPKPLDGNDVLSSDRIVLLARIQDPGEPADWKDFSLQFNPQNGKTFDYERLRNRGYYLSIVFTSSIDGASFIGAVGSTLYVDEVEIIN